MLSVADGNKEQLVQPQTLQTALPNCATQLQEKTTMSKTERIYVSCQYMKLMITTNNVHNKASNNIN